jgi:hypothetical protein
MIEESGFNSEQQLEINDQTDSVIHSVFSTMADGVMKIELSSSPLHVFMA